MNINKDEKKAIFELLTSCNLNCAHCFYKTLQKFCPSNFLSKKKVFILIRKMAKNKIDKLVLTGGEPTLHPDFIEISKYAMSKLAKVTVCTNGFIKNRQLEEDIIKLNFSTYTVSIDSHIEGVHNEFRGNKNAFKKTIAFIKRLKLNNKNISIHITIYPGNIRYIDRTIAFCRKFSNEIVVSTVYHDRLVVGGKNKEYNQKLNFFKKKYLKDQNIILVGFAQYCKNKNCLNQKNIFMVNAKGELVDCYWKKNGGLVKGKY